MDETVLKGPLVPVIIPLVRVMPLAGITSLTAVRFLFGRNPSAIAGFCGAWIRRLHARAWVKAILNVSVAICRRYPTLGESEMNSFAGLYLSEKVRIWRVAEALWSASAHDHGVSFAQFYEARTRSLESSLPICERIRRKFRAPQGLGRVRECPVVPLIALAGKELELLLSLAPITVPLKD